MRNMNACVIWQHELQRSSRHVQAFNSACNYRRDSHPTSDQTTEYFSFEASRRSAPGCKYFGMSHVTVQHACTFILGAVCHLPSRTLGRRCCSPVLESSYLMLHIHNTPNHRHLPVVKASHRAIVPACSTCTKIDM